MQPQFNSTLVSVSSGAQREFDKSIIGVYGTPIARAMTPTISALASTGRFSRHRSGQSGHQPTPLYIESKGETNPIASNATEQGRAQNRRVEIQITPINRG
ncbi:MAG: hypothetical protein MO852_08185 [Candidatus Devosia euplotis]|nr:hypothetical protein [Candidatus Devosia euplotis]